MKNFKIVVLALFILLICIGSASAQNTESIDANQTADDLSVAVDLNNQNNLKSGFDDVESANDLDAVVANDWNDLQYYCSLNDKDYVVKLKENTNYYPADVSDSNYQINIKNNVHIIGAEGAYIGDVSPEAGKLTYTAIKVDDNNGIGVTLDNVKFKWIATRYQPDGVFFVMGGNSHNAIKNCYFTNITTDLGHSSILHLKRGTATLDNCTFINCTTDFGCVSIYDPKDDPTKTCTGASMQVNDCYFEGNYAKTEPGCINNCGILVVNNSTFIRNSAFWWAGAIHTHGGANTTIYDSDFYDNLAGWNGGALYTYSYLQIYNSRFIGNNCTTNNGGGAIGACKYLHAPYIHIEDSLFENNENLCWGLDGLSTSGTGRGGAISFMDEGSLEVYNSKFIKNSASIGTAICAISGGKSYGSPDVKIIGNTFINHTRIGDVLDVRVATGSAAEIRDNNFFNNSIVFSKLKLAADDPVNGKVTFHLDAVLKNPKSYDEDILKKSKYDVYVNGVYKTTVSSTDFTLDLGKGNTARVYVVPCISTSKSNEVFAGIAKTYIYVSQSRGNDNNDGSRSKPVKTLNKSIELARSHENIIIMDGTFKETNLVINYNLTVVGEKNVMITATGNIFTITNGDVKFENIIFKNCKYGGSNTKNRIISQTSKGFLTIEGCVFDSNEYKSHIEANVVEGENLKFINNKDGSVIKADSLVLKSSEFINNIATYSGSKGLLMYKLSPVKFEVENLTFIGNTVNSGCIAVKNIKATVDGCTFIGNTATGKGSAISVESSSNFLIQSSKFINNTDTGKYSTVIYLASSALIKDSIFINNSNEVDLNINGNEASLKKLTANNNWWGNTPDNLSKPALKTFPIANTLPNGWDPASYWLVLNGTAISNDIDLYKRIPVQFIFTQIDNEGNVTSFDGGFMPSIDLTLKAVNGTCSDKKITMVNGMATTYFTLTEMSGGSLTASFNGIDSTIYFNFKKTTPTISIAADNITVGNAAQIGITLDTGVNGNVILKVGNVTQTKPIYTSTTFTIPDLPAGNYTIEANYTGNERYESVVSTAKLSVNKLSSDINISYGAVALGSDVVFTFALESGATGTIEVYVNGNKKQTINTGQTYTITKISRGGYVVKAIYTGDNRYLASEDEVRLEVGKLTPTITAEIPEVTYGRDTIVSVSLNSDAAGNVTVTVDGKTNSSKINGGKASITLSNLNAGTNKNALIFYSGDNNYKNSSLTKTFNVGKAKLDFTITSSNIKVGQDAVVQISLPARIGGTISLSGIKNEMKTVPVTGIVKLTYSDLDEGTYTVTARYDGDNYQTASKSTTFEVSLWDEPQWANEGGDVRHSGKSSYDSAVNGELKWSAEVGEITGNLAIDSQGNIYITSKEGIYSLDANGNLRWKYLSNDAGSTFAGIAISRDVIIAPKADDTIYFINQTTGERYGHANIFQGSSNFPPIVDANGNVYTSGQGDANNPNLVIIPYKMWENGGTPSVIQLGSSPNGAPVLINDNLAAVPSENGLVIVDIPSNKLIATISGNTDNGYAVVGEGNIIYTILEDSIRAISSEGTTLWTTKVSGGIGNRMSLDSEQGVYSVNAKGELYKYDIIDGSESKFTNLTVTSGILVGSDSNLYFASDEFVYALDVDGNVLWKAKLDGEITGTPIMDKNRIIYVNSMNKVYALKQANLRDVSLVITTKTINVDESESISITLNENATGFIDLTVNGNTTKEEIIAGKIVKTFSNLKSGDYNVTVKYSGDLRYSQTTKSDKFKVLKLIPQMNVTANNIKYGEDAVFDVVLPVTAEGTVTVNVNGKSNSAKLIKGKASVRISGLAKKDYNYTVSYSGDGYYNSTAKTSIISVGKVEFTFNVAEISDVKVDSPVEFVITGVPSDAGGRFSVSVADISNQTAPNSGQAKIVINGLKVGNYTGEIVYFDDNNYMANSKNIQFKVIKKDVSFTLTVNNISVGDVAKFIISGLPNDAEGNINVIVDDINQSKSLNNGQTIIEAANLTYGNKKATVIFEGDDKYNSKTLTKEFKVNKINPSFTIDDIGQVYVSDNVELGAYLNPDAYGNISMVMNGENIGNISFTNGKANLIITALTYGNKTVEFTYSGNEKYSAKTITKTFAVDKITPELNVVSPLKVNVGDEIIFSVKLPVGVTGIVNITVGNVTKTVTAKANLEISISNLTEGNKKAIITYSGDSKYYSNSVSKEFEVVKNPLNMAAIVEDTKYGNPTKFIVHLNSDASGTVSVNVDGKTVSGEVNNGSAVIELNGLSLGSKTAVITYSGDNRYESNKITKEFTISNVDKANVTMDASVLDINVGDNAVFTVTLNSDASGRVTVSVDGISYSDTISKGKATVTLKDLTYGMKKALISYDGDSKYKSAIISKEFKVNKIAPVGNINAHDIKVGDNAEFTIALNSDASGSVTVSVDGKSNYSDMVNGKSKITLSGLSFGEKSATVTYSGDDKYLPATYKYEFKVNRIAPELSVKANNINVGEIAVFEINLNSDSSGIVSVDVDGKFTSTNFAGGSFKINIDGLTSGNKKAVIAYMGNEKYLPANVTCDLSVSKLKPQINVKTEDINYGELAIFDIALNPDSSGTVTVNIDGKTYSNKLNNGIVKITVDGLTSGIKKAIINYNGDDKYLPLNTSCDVSVNKLNSQIRIKTDDINAGQIAVINIESSLEDAEIILTVNGKNYDLIIKDGKTSLTVPDLTAGVYNVVATFAGDENHNNVKNSTTFTVTKKEIHVNNDTIPESSNPAEYSINLPDDATGTLTVSVDGKNYTQKLVNGKATVNIPELSNGNHNIIVSYSGDGKYSQIVKTKVITVNNIIPTHFNTEEGMLFKVYAVDYNVGERGKTLSFKLLDANNNTVSGVSVQLTYNKKVFNRTTNADGTVSFGVSTQIAGDYAASIYYGGNVKYAPSKVSFKIKVNKKPLSITAKAKTFKAKTKTKKYTITLKTKKCSSKNGKIYLKSGKKLTLKIKGKTYTAKINKKGKATFKITKLTKKGKYTAVIKYKGDKTYKAITKKVKITIK